MADCHVWIELILYEAEPMPFLSFLFTNRVYGSGQGARKEVGMNWNELSTCLDMVLSFELEGDLVDG